MAKTISLFTANAEVQYIAPKDVSLVHSVANQPTIDPDTMVPAEHEDDQQEADYNQTVVDPGVGYNQTVVDPGVGGPEENHDDPDVPTVATTGPTGPTAEVDLAPICINIYGHILGGLFQEECKETPSLPSNINNELYCFTSVFTFTLNPELKLNEMQDRTLLKIVRPRKEQFSASDTSFINRDDTHCIMGEEQFLGNHGWGGDTWKALGFKSLQFFFISSSIILLCYDGIKACNFACPRGHKPQIIAVNKVDNYFTLRGYRRRYADLDWDEIINKLIDLLSKIFHIFIYVLVYYPLNFVTSCLLNSGPKISISGVEVTEVESYGFFMTMLTVMNIYFIAQFCFSGAGFFVITHPKALRCVIPCASKCFLDFCYIVAIMTMSLFFVTYLTEIENKYMDFFVQLEYDMYDRNTDVNKMNDFKLDGKPNVKNDNSYVKETFYAHMKMLSKNKDFHYLASCTNDQQAGDANFFIILKFKREYMREEVETLLNQKQGPLRPKITFIFDNAAAEQKAIMSKPHKIHVEEQTFRPSFFDREKEQEKKQK
eukprot:g6198.t1